MDAKVYEFSRCSTCVKALKYLDAQKIKYTKIPIVEQPPTKKELKTMLGYLQARGGSLKNLFNTSGELYREMKLSDRIKAGLSESEALDLLAKHGKLIKRPFVLTKNNGVVGFKEDEWNQILK